MGISGKHSLCPHPPEELNHPGFSKCPALLFSVLAPAVPCLDNSHLLNLTLSLRLHVNAQIPPGLPLRLYVGGGGSVDLGHWTCIGFPGMVHSLRATGAEWTPSQRAPSTWVTSEYRCEPLGLPNWILSSGRHTLASLCP